MNMAIPSRAKSRFWPVPPLIALVGTVIAFTQQKPSDILIVVAIAVAGTLYYYLYLKPRAATHWTMTVNAADELARLRAEA